MNEHKESSARRIRGSPFLDWDTETDWATLEAEEKLSQEAPETQEQLAEFLNYNPDELDVERIEAENRAYLSSPKSQEQLRDYLETQQVIDRMTAVPDFWNSSSLNDGMLNVQPFKTQVATPDAKGPTVPQIDLLKFGSGTRDLTSYAVAQWLIQNIPIKKANRCLHFYADYAYMPSAADDAKSKILEACRSAVEAVGSTNLVNQVFKTLLMENRLIQDSDLCLNTVALDDVLVDLDTGALLPHTPDIFVTTRLDASYHRGCSSDCPTFKKFLKDICRGDDTLAWRIWECLGYLLAPDQTAKLFVFFQGVPNSGKSVLGNFIRGCFKGDAVTSLELNEFCGRFNLSDLVGKKLCLDMDLPATPLKERAVSNLKNSRAAIRFLLTSSFRAG